MKLIKATLLLVVLSIFRFNSFGSHIPGGNITYQCVGPNQYEITLTLYEDCGTAFETNSAETIDIANSCGIAGLTSASLTNSTFQVEVSQLCPGELPNSECNGGTLPGVWQHTWTGIITLPADLFLGLFLMIYVVEILLKTVLLKIIFILKLF